MLSSVLYYAIRSAVFCTPVVQYFVVKALWLAISTDLKYMFNYYVARMVDILMKYYEHSIM